MSRVPNTWESAERLVHQKAGEGRKPGGFWEAASYPLGHQLWSNTRAVIQCCSAVSSVIWKMIIKKFHLFVTEVKITDAKDFIKETIMM